MMMNQIRPNTKQLMDMYKFEDDAGRVIKWTEGQLEIIDFIINRGSIDGKKRGEILASTRYGKSLAVGAGVSARAVTEPEKWAIVAGTKEKAQIIMDYVIMFSLNNPIIATQLDPATSLDRLRMRRSQDRIVYKRKGQVRVFSADARLIANTSKALMGFGSPNVIEDEAALIPDVLQATVMRMLGDQPDNFLAKIGNPFNRGHFYRSWMSDKYHHIFIDHKRALREGRFSQEFIDEMKEEAMFDILYACEFPDEGMIDDKGWLPLLTDSEVEMAMVKEIQPFGFKRLGIDVAGGGRNYSVMVCRNYNVAQIVYKKNEPDTMRFTGNIIHFANELGVKDEDLFIDRVGVGKGPYDRLLEVKNKVVGLSGADKPTNQQMFVNKRAEMFWRVREWILRGGKLQHSEDWLELTKIKYKVADSSGKIQIMSKVDMLREGVDSPDVADALAHTFYRSEPEPDNAQPFVAPVVPQNIGDPFYIPDNPEAASYGDPYANDL